MSTPVVHNTCASDDKPRRPKKKSGKGHPGRTKGNDGANAKYDGRHGIDHSKSKIPRPLPFPTTYRPFSAPRYVDTAVKVVDGLKGPMTAAKIATDMSLMTDCLLPECFY